METILAQLSYFVPLAVVNDRAAVLQLLTENRIVIDPKVSDQKLTEIVMNKIFDSESFRNSFDRYIRYVGERLGYAGSDGFWSTSGAGGALSGLFSSGLGYLASTQVSKDQKAIANSQAQSNLALAQAQMSASQNNLEIAKLQLEAAKSNPQNNTALYIVMALVGLVSMAGIVYAVTKKSN